LRERSRLQTGDIVQRGNQVVSAATLPHIIVDGLMIC
jgi:hypothetical protein